MTPLEHDCLRTIKRIMSRKDVPPSYREIGRAMGVESTSTISRLVLSLESQGKIRTSYGRTRSIELIAGPYDRAKLETLSSALLGDIRDHALSILADRLTRGEA